MEMEWEQLAGKLPRRGWRARMAPSALLMLLFCLLSGGGCGSHTPSPPSASTRLHLVAVLYGKYVSAHTGEMPANQEELTSYVDAQEKEVLQRRGLRSAADIFVDAARQPELIVLYRDARERLQTEFVAIEEQASKRRTRSDKTTKRDRSGSKWFAADILGVGRVLRDDESSRILTETIEIADADESKQQAPDADTAGKEGSAEPEKGNKS